MSVVAVAGGTGQLGRCIVEAIVVDGTYEVVILARQVFLSSQICFASGIDCPK